MKREDKKSYLSSFVEEERKRDPEFGDAFDRELLAIRLINMRAALGLTQKDVAERMGTHQSNVARFERSPVDAKFGTVLAYLEALGISDPLRLESSTLVVRESSARGTYRKSAKAKPKPKAE